MNTVKINRKNVKLIAHRGLSGLETQNTAAAFVAAGNRSYYGIESDVHVTKDKKYIIIHDDTTMNVTNEDYTVEETDFNTLRGLQIKNTDGNKNRADLVMPTLEEYLMICEKYEKIAVLELKNRMSKQDITGIYNIIKKMNYLDNTIIISFVLDNLIDLKKIDPKQSAQFLVGKIYSEKIIDILKEHNLDVDIYYENVTKKTVSLLHKNGIKVNVWTVDSPESAKKLVNMGVDYITTNILE